MLKHDLNQVLEKTKLLWEEVRGEKIFITGGTGFIGCWLLETFIWANQVLDLKAEMGVLTRNKAAFANKYPHIANHPAILLYEGDVKNFNYPAVNFKYFILGAAEYNNPDFLDNIETLIEGSKHTLQFAKLCSANKILLLSSGAIYGKSHQSMISEDHPLVFEHTSEYASYTLGKCVAESLSYWYGKENNLAIKIARCFTFMGPYLSLDNNFAICSFIRQALAGQSILLSGNGLAYRSYLYAADLAVWLWTILFSGEALRFYNVGSDQAISMRELAEAVAMHFKPCPKVQMAANTVENTKADWYVPDINRACQELQLTVEVTLADAIARTINWYKRLD